MNFWEDQYRVEEDGKVFRKKGYQCNIERQLKPATTKAGYFRLLLNVNGKRRNMLVSRLVALTYIPNPDNKPFVDHIDRNRKNNHFTNLRWVTNIENMQNRQPNKTGEYNILIHSQNNNFCIKFTRNYICYSKALSNDCTIEQAVIQRDLMLSMF